MPASVPSVAAPVIAPAPGDALAALPAAEVGEVSFEAVLAAHLEAVTGSDPQAGVILAAAADAPASDGTAATPEAAEPAVLALDIAGETPLQAPLEPAGQPALAVPQPIPAPSLAVPASDPGVRPASPALEPPARASRAVPELPEAARIAGPSAAPGLQQTAQPAAVVLSSGDSPSAAPLPTHAQQTEVAAALVPPAAERTEQARPGVQPLRLDVAAPVGSRDFSQEVGHRMVWMATQNRQVAELRIDPPQLGPIEVRLSISNDQASLSFLSPHASVRDALQASVPRLQEMLQGLGISLEQVSVSAEAFGQGGGRNAFDQGWSGAHEQGLSGLSNAAPDDRAALTGAGGLPLRTGVGMVDVYA